ncbi:MAG: Asp-tRNA(Asn)/Glu-tRNA(Gln) amidotransferase subunit GatB, partial [Erysipelotrichaceae bacterium]|nr:Asp-tRNA(Asn)/Glu-tRNA(Gln) amidotransferase subunit GatB [Erysipelotrichaceae bacterium]
MKYQTVIGLEIHLVLNTRTKMFSSAPCSFESPANTCVNEIDMALPGTLPCLNKEAVRKALSLCLALDMDIDTLIRFDRKNYYYSDLPKGYQITQHFHPLGKNGKVMIDSSEGVKQIVIESLHLEEDTAKQFHRDDETLIDYNRCGLPLLEIVSAPHISSSEEAASYLSKLQQIFRYLDISNARMEEGEMRCDVNISLKETDASALGHKVEVKNLNSISNVKDAIDHETARQKEILEKGEEVAKETRRFDEKTKTTVMMRRKEDVIDYKYLREPNIFPIRITEEDLQEIRNTMPVLPETKYRTYIREYGLSEYTAECLLKD